MPRPGLTAVADSKSVYHAPLKAVNVSRNLEAQGENMASQRPAAAESDAGVAGTEPRKQAKGRTAKGRQSASGATETVGAEMVLWRVFGCSNDYAGRPSPLWSVEEAGGPASGDRMMLALGDLPDDLIVTLRQWRAQANGLLDQVFGGASFEDRLRRYEDDLASVELPEFADPYPSWLTLRLSRPASVKGLEGATIAWLDEPETPLQMLAEFEAVGARYLDGVVAQLFSLPAELNLGLIRYNDRRAYLTAPGRAAMREPRLEMSIKDAGVVVGTSWDRAPTGALESLVKGLSERKGVGRLTAVPARWLSAALSESDELRRFIFAFVGLETLSTLNEKSSRESLVARVSQADPTLPVKELIWPGKSDDFVDRNLVFRFAAMAAVHSPATTETDVSTFARLAKARNDLFHGSDNSIDRNMAIECQNLLRKYLGLVATMS